MGVAALADRPFATLSSGERQRALIARTLMTDRLVLLDEPAAGLDLGAARGARRADRRARRRPGPAGDGARDPSRRGRSRRGFGHAPMAAGRVLAAGPIETTLTGPALSSAFGLRLAIERRRGPYTARATG